MRMKTLAETKELHLQAKRHKVSQVTRKVTSPRVSLKLRIRVCQALAYVLQCMQRSKEHTVGGGFCSVIINTFMGGNLANGAWPCASSRSVIPRDLRVRSVSRSKAYACSNVCIPNVSLLVVSIGLLHDLRSHPAVHR